MTLEIVEIRRDDTFALRRSVLRAGDPDAVVAWDDDVVVGAMHLGAQLDGALVATSTWIPRPFPAAADERSDHDWQLRGMATADGRRGTGIGAVLLQAGCERCREVGGRLAWARARDAALGFYEREGFSVFGDGFTDATTALPHHLVRRELA